MVKLRSIYCLPPTGVSHSILPWIVWSIWLARNSLVFDARSSSAEEVATRALWLAREWTSAQGSPLQQQQQHGRTPRIKQSPSILEGETLCRTDAAWNKQQKRAGLAWIFTGNGFPSAKEGSTTQEHVDSPLVAEALAMRLALIKAATLEITSLRMSSDNLTLIRAISNGMQVKEIHGIVCDIQAISSAFANIKFSHISRDFNREADASAKLFLLSVSALGP